MRPPRERRPRARSRRARGLPRASCGRSSRRCRRRTTRSKRTCCGTCSTRCAGATSPPDARAVRAVSAAAAFGRVPRARLARARAQRRGRAARRRLPRGRPGCRPPATTKSSCATSCSAATRGDAEQYRAVARSHAGSTPRSRPRSCSPASATPTRDARARSERAPPRCASASSSRGACTTRRGSPSTSRSCSKPTSSTCPSCSSKCSASIRSRTSSTNRSEVDTDLDLDGLAASHEHGAALRRAADSPRAPPHRAADVHARRHVRHRSRSATACRVARSSQGPAALRRRASAPPVTSSRSSTRQAACAPMRAHGSAIASTSPTRMARSSCRSRRRPTRTPMLLSCGDIATVAAPRARARDVRARARPPRSIAKRSIERRAPRGRSRALQLTVAGAPVSLALLEQPSWDVTLTDRSGVATTKSVPLVLSDDDAAVLEFPLGEATATSRSPCRGKLQVVSEQRDQSSAQTRDVAGRDDARHDRDRGALPRAHRRRLGALGARQDRRAARAAPADGHARPSLGRTSSTSSSRPTRGPLRARRAARHRADHRDPRRRDADLGAEQRLAVRDVMLTSSRQATSCIALPASRDGRGRDPSRIARRAARRRSGAPSRREIEPLAGGIVVRGLGAGEYALRAPGLAHVSDQGRRPASELAGTRLTAERNGRALEGRARRSRADRDATCYTSGSRASRRARACT